MSAENILTQLGKQSQNFASQNSGDNLPLSAAGTGREMFCNFVSTGEGAAFPIIILPRFIPIIMAPIPRLFVGWKTSEGFTSVGGLVSGTGFYAVGQQQGIALGFWGIGFSIFLPPIMSYGLFGYALYTRVTAEVFEFYPPNTPPEITQTDPADGEQMVPVTTTELRFEIYDAEGELMSYTVTTEPNIGTGSGGLKPDGVYSVPVSGLESLTTYTWYIEVTDEKDTTENTITFTTEPAAPIISNPLPENGDRDVPMNLPQLQFTLKDYQGDAMEFTVQTSPDIGSDHKVGVHDGTYTIPISGMTYGALYRWYVNVTDGTHWARKMYSFTTGYPSPFNPFEYGWQYRKQIIDMLIKAYWMELETVTNYIANSVNLDGVRAEEIKKSLAADVTAEIAHAQLLAKRVKEVGGIVPGSLGFRADQKSLQPPANTTDVVAVIRGVIDADIACKALTLLEVDVLGLDISDRRVLDTIIVKFDGGPVGVESLAAAIGEERGTIEDVIEPYLIQQGYLMRTPRGRMATQTAYLHLGLAAPSRLSQEPPIADLFGNSTAV